MTQGRVPRQPGDPAPGDRDFGPLGGLFDDLHYTHRAAERAREMTATRAARHGERLPSAFGRAVATLRRLAGRPG